MKKIVISIVLVNLLAACASNKPAENTAGVSSGAAATSSSKGALGAKSAGGTSAGTTVAPGAGITDGALNNQAGILSKRSVFYPFDIDVIQDEDRPIVQAHGRYLATIPSRAMRLEGNCDERGSNEYNLALGQRRADGVKRMLELSGAKAGQLESVSFGEEKPRATGHEESSWSQNRRTDLNYVR